MASRIPRRSGAGVARRWGRALRLAAPLLPAALLLAACNLDVTTPSRLQASSLNNPANAQLLVDGAEGDFQCAYGDYVVVSGLISGELADASQTASRWSYDRRVIEPSETQYGQSSCAALGIYTPLQTARFTNVSTLAKLQTWTDEQVPNRQDLIAQTAAYAGYTILLLGEGFCEAPAETLGPALTQAQLFAKAEEYFTTAIAAAQAASDDDLLNLAYVGRARARLDQGNLDGAAADATLVPADFEYTLATVETSGRLSNRVYSENNQGAEINIGVSYLDPGSFPVKIDTLPNGDEREDSRHHTLWIQQKYPKLDSPYVVASGAEAQLILAEAEGTLTGATLVEARRTELFLSGTRLYDIKRFMAVDPSLVPLVPAPGSDYERGGQYGDLGGKMCMPLPDIERLNNPSMGG
jgi:hypothetical protein